MSSRVKKKRRNVVYWGKVLCLGGRTEGASDRKAHGTQEVCHLGLERTVNGHIAGGTMVMKR